MAEEGFVLAKIALADFGVAVGKAAAGQAEAHIGMWAERAADAEFRIHVDRGEGQAQGLAARQVAEAEAAKAQIVQLATGDTVRKRTVEASPYLSATRMASA